MEREDTLKFINSVVLLSKLLAKVEERFLAEKLYGKISDMVLVFIEYVVETELRRAESIAKSNSAAQHPINVAQYYYKNLLNSIRGVLDCLEYLEHDTKNNITPLLLAHKNLLKLKLHILKHSQVTKLIEKKTESQPTSVSEIKIKPALKNKAAGSPLKSNSSKEKIFNFIKRFPDVRTKKIISEFNALSDRTVKRNLKELIDEGLLKKKSEDGAVYYLVTNL